jgi:hypothetical protein
VNVYCALSYKESVFAIVSTGRVFVYIRNLTTMEKQLRKGERLLDVK